MMDKRRCKIQRASWINFLPNRSGALRTWFQDYSVTYQRPRTSHQCLADHRNQSILDLPSHPAFLHISHFGRSQPYVVDREKPPPPCRSKEISRFRRGNFGQQHITRYTLISRTEREAEKRIFNGTFILMRRAATPDDLKSSFMRPDEVHYIRFGKKEQRARGGSRFFHWTRPQQRRCASLLGLGDDAYSLFHFTVQRWRARVAKCNCARNSLPRARSISLPLSLSPRFEYRFPFFARSCAAGAVAADNPRENPSLPSDFPSLAQTDKHERESFSSRMPPLQQLPRRLFFSPLLSFDPVVPFWLCFLSLPSLLGENACNATGNV